MHHFCTYFDHNYLPRARALYESLRRHSSPFTFWVLCLSEECHRVLEALNLPGVRILPMDAFEAGDAELLKARSNRSRVEYYFTLTPSLPLHVFRLDPSIDRITYLDSDLYFFQDVQRMFDQIGDASIAIIPHGNDPGKPGWDQFGLYNVGWLTFRRDAQGMACLERWRGQCNEWCHDRVEDGKFGDQRYLDEWPGRYSACRVLTHPGANLAPWNLGMHRTEYRSSGWMVDGQPLLFFHFQGIKQIRTDEFDPQLWPFETRLSPALRDHLYAPYLEEVRHWTTDAARHLHGMSGLRQIRHQAAAPGLRTRLRQWQRRIAGQYIRLRSETAGTRS